MELQHLRTFLAVAQARSLTRAAQQVHLSQPAVSAHIKALEDELRIILFHRTGRGMKPTDAAEQLMPEARDLLTRVEGFQRRAAQLAGGVVGAMRVGVMDCGYDLRLARILGQTRLRHPDLRIEVQTSNSTQNITGVLDQQLDAAFAEGEWEEPRLRIIRVGTSRLGIIAPTIWRDRLTDGGWPRLSEFPWVFQSRGCSYCKLLHTLGEQHHVRFKPEFRTEAFGAVKDLVVEGLALSVADLDEVQPWIDQGLVFAWGGFEVAMPVNLVVLAQRQEEPMIRTFLSIAQQVHRGGLGLKAKVA